MLLAVLWRLGYKLGFRDVAELLLQGYEVSNETIRGWEARFAPLLTEQLRGKRPPELRRELDRLAAELAELSGGVTPP